jgi:hypothetical protein
MARLHRIGSLAIFLLVFFGDLIGFYRKEPFTTQNQSWSPERLLEPLGEHVHESNRADHTPERDVHAAIMAAPDIPFVPQEDDYAPMFLAQVRRAHQLAVAQQRGSDLFHLE